MAKKKTLRVKKESVKQLTDAELKHSVGGVVNHPILSLSVSTVR